jgi:EpsI family protein
MMRGRGSWTRVLCVAVLMMAASIVLNVRSRAENLPAARPLASFPLRIGEWTGQDVPLASDVLQVLGKGDFLTRIYRSAAQPPMDLYIAYFPSQRTGSTIHSPQNCLPGAGWAPIESGRMFLPRADGTSMLVNRYIVQKGSDRLVVFYWYQAHGRVVASEYSAKFYLVADSIRMNRTDGSLVRVITAIGKNETEGGAESRAVAFTQHVVPLLDSYIPR